MTYEQRENSGSLFKNENKENENHPNATGKALIGGIMYYVSAWTKEGAKGKWQSLAFKPVEEKTLKPNGKIEDMESDVPF
jgi:hypothetical protein